MEHRRRPPRPTRRRPRSGSTRSRSARRKRRRRRSRTSATRSSSVRVSLVDRRDRIQTARARTSHRCWPARATAATSSRTTSRRCGRSRRRSRPSWPRLQRRRCRAGPDQARLGRPDLAGQRPDHLAVLRVARVGVLPPGHRHRRPVRHADPRRRGRARSSLMQPEAASGGYGNFTCIQHAGVALHLLRAPVALRHLDGRAASARARSSATSAARAAASAPHLHFETRINGVRREPDELPVDAPRSPARSVQPETPHLRPDAPDASASAWALRFARRGLDGRAAPEGARPAASTGPTRWSSPR